MCHFIEGYGNDAPFELAYLVLPLVLREESRSALCRLNKTSTIYSAFLDGKEKRIRITALQYYVQAYKGYVNPSLIIYSKKGNEFGLTLKNLNSYDYSKEKDKTTKAYFKAAYCLGAVFSKEKTPDCFYKLGVFKI